MDSSATTARTSGDSEDTGRMPASERPIEPPPENTAFSPTTFSLLNDLHLNPTYKFYSAHREEFKRELEEPFKKLLSRVADRLPAAIADRMETQKGVFARIKKNDWARGGAWDFYWGAFYPKGGKRTQDAQLFAWINRERLEFGFYIGEYASEQRKRYVRNCQKNRDELIDTLRDSISTDTLAYDRRDDFVGGSARSSKGRPPISGWEDWIRRPEETGIHVAVVIGRDDVLSKSAEELTQEIARTFERVFPLVLLAVSDDPMQDITRFLGPRNGQTDVNPDYSLAQCALETGVEEKTLKNWVNAIERKGQAIIYGPPGTGKTHLAVRLARHIIAASGGFQDVVQFHPSYAYEDFIQGIRPQARPDGKLDYKVIPGRFLEFCRNASSRDGRCVLIIDEINRANLARVFGELMYLLEYRDRAIPLASGGELAIPANVRIIGTMNTADRSIALVDHALRRRFAFLALYPNYEVLRHFHREASFPVDRFIDVLRRLNEQIDDRHYEVGITFFLRENLAEELEHIWRMEIEPYLEEYFFDQPDRVDDYRWDRIENQLQL